MAKLRGDEPLEAALSDIPNDLPRAKGVPRELGVPREIRVPPAYRTSDLTVEYEAG